MSFSLLSAGGVKTATGKVTWRQTKAYETLGQADNRTIQAYKGRKRFADGDGRLHVFDGEEGFGRFTLNPCSRTQLITYTDVFAGYGLNSNFTYASTY